MCWCEQLHIDATHSDAVLHFVRRPVAISEHPDVGDDLCMTMDPHAAPTTTAWVRPLIAALVVISAALAAAATTVYLRGATARTHEVTGAVRCASGAPVRGVWVGNEVGGGDWAAWTADPGDPARATYTFTVRGDKYTVHIGCGGTKDAWGVECQSEYVRGESNDLLCQDQH